MSLIINLQVREELKSTVSLQWWLQLLERILLSWSQRWWMQLWAVLNSLRIWVFPLLNWTLLLRHHLVRTQIRNQCLLHLSPAWVCQWRTMSTRWQCLKMLSCLESQYFPLWWRQFWNMNQQQFALPSNRCCSSPLRNQRRSSCMAPLKYPLKLNICDLYGTYAECSSMAASLGK